MTATCTLLANAYQLHRREREGILIDSGARSRDMHIGGNGRCDRATFVAPIFRVES